MKSVLTGLIAASLIAIAAAFVLQGEFQKPAESFHTEGVRL